MNATRRNFLQLAGGTAAALRLGGLAARADEKPIPGFENAVTDREAAKSWKPVSDRKIRVGIAGYGYCKFGAAFGFQNHPNVTVAAVTDLIPGRCAELAQACRCAKTYPSCEEMLKDDSLEAVFLATDAPSHARLAIAALQAAKHVASAVPAVFGSLDEADQLLRAVKTAGRQYMMFETSVFHEDLYAMSQMYRAGRLGKVVYAEGEYWHYMTAPLPSYDPESREVNLKGWRVGLPPQWYPTHSNAYYVGVTGGSFTEVSCMGMPSILEHLQPGNNRYKNPFGTEIALFRTSEGGKGEALIKRPPLPPGVDAGGHGGAHGNLMSEFVEAILQNRKPLVDVARALALTAGGIVAHQSACKDGELLQIPQYAL